MATEQTRGIKALIEEALRGGDKQNWQVLATDWNVREQGERFQA